MYKNLNVNRPSYTLNSLYLKLNKWISQDFDELMEMGSKGDGETTDIYARHLKNGGGKDMYDALHDDLLIFAFGQATAKSRG